MVTFIQEIRILLYPFGYFLALGIVYGITRFATLFLVAAGRLKGFYAIENYWVYITVILLCALVGIAVGQGDLIVFARWFLSSLLTSLIGVHFGYDKGIKISDDDLEEVRKEAEHMNDDLND